MEQLTEDCISLILARCNGPMLATLAMVSTEWTRRVLATETSRFTPPVVPIITGRGAWFDLIASGAYLTVVRSKYGEVKLKGACYSGNQEMVDLALRLGAIDYQNGFETAAIRGHYHIAMQMWDLMTAPNIRDCVRATYRGADPRLMQLFDDKMDDQAVRNDAVFGACRGGQIELLKRIIHTYSGVSSGLLYFAFCSRNAETIGFLLDEGHKCDDEGGIIMAMNHGEYNIVHCFYLTDPSFDTTQAFYGACRKGHLEKVPCLALNKSAQELDRGLTLACIGRYLGVIKHLSTFEDFAGWDAVLARLDEAGEDIESDVVALPADSYEEIVEYCRGQL
jgi:hypothetical protein